MAKRSSWSRRDFVTRNAALIASLSSGSLASCIDRPRSGEGDRAAVGREVIDWARSIRGTVLIPGTAGYEDGRQAWNRAFDRFPAAVIRCADVQDVVRVVNFARTRDLVLAVRGGGHSAAGHSVSDGGLVLDLGSMTDVVVDRDGSVARAQSGAKVRDLLEAVVPLGLATPSGGCPDVGLSGFTLGGGESALSGKYGLACDNVVAAQVVTADGDVLVTSASENSDLFWAIRGGGGNFGVVTTLEYRLHSLEQVVTGSIAFAFAGAAEALRTYRELMHDAPDELQTSLFFRSGPNGPSCAIPFTYCGDVTAGEQLVARWRGALRSTGGPTRTAAYSAGFVLPPAVYASTGAFIPELSDAAIDTLLTHVEAAPPSAIVIANDYHGAVVRRSLADAAFPIRRPGYSFGWLCPSTTSAERREAVDWVTRLRVDLLPFSSGVYVNVLEDEGQERVRDAYGSNYTRLAALKQRYDPRNLFHMNQNIQPG